MKLEPTPRELQLRDLAREHWKEHRPKMYRELWRTGQLQEAIEEAARETDQAWDQTEAQLKAKNPAPKTDDIMEMVQYHNWAKDTAWEMVREMWILLPTEEDVPNLAENPQETIIL
jgi:hypothetical protein